MKTHDELCNAMRKKINHAGLQRAHELFPGTTWSKFFDTDTFIHAAAQHALRFDAELKPGSNCIDIGAGFGYVALALECLGHQCTAWDAPVNVLQTIAPYIPVSHRIFKTIERIGDDREELYLPPMILGGYDLILLHGVWPMRDARGWWESVDYAILGNALVSGLAPGGRLEILVNRGDQLSVCCDMSQRWASLRDESKVSFFVSDNVIDVRRAAPLLV